MNPRFHPGSLPRGALGALHAERLYELLGVERPQIDVSRHLRLYVQGERAPVSGAMLVGCSDEAEKECADAFDRQFARYLCPSLKFFDRAVFRTATLGGRYQWGSVRIAEEHFALAQRPGQWKCLVVKINAHVSVEERPDGVRYGRGQRFGSESVYCGALDACLAGSELPFACELAQDFALEGVDRVAELRDPERVRPEHRSLLAAVCSARLQARRAMMDIQDHAPAAPTLYLVLPCVSLNRRGHDTEIVCGVYTADRREERHDEYCGLGDRPSAYRLGAEGGVARITDPESDRPREARDHRALVLEVWRGRSDEGSPRQALAEVDRRRGPGARDYAGPALKTLLGLMLELAPVPGALLCFGAGLAGIHQVHRAHRLAHEAGGDEEARAILREIHDRVDTLPPEKARRLEELLRAEISAPR